METNNEQENKFGFKVVDEFITNNLALSMTCSIIALLNLLMGQLLFKVSSLTFAVIFSTFTVIIYLKYKDIASEGVNKLYFTSLKIIMPLISMLIINGLFLTFVRNVSRDNLLAVGGLCIMMDIIIIGGFLMLYSQEELMNNLKVLHEKKLGSTNSIENDEEIQPGDAVLGYAIDEDGKSTKKPVILPLKDRFLHMLILGPTGCGKTSQSVIPMINRDMQNPNMGITVLEPKGDLAEKIFAMAKHYNREVLYFNPTLPDCPYFNPLYGKESDVVENMATTFNMLNPDSPQFFKDMSEGLIRRSIKILKRVYGNDATLLHLSDLVWNTEERGEIIIEMLQVAKNNFVDPEVQKENDELVYWYSTDYYSGLSGDRGASKTFEHCSGVRSQISKLV
ncbi:MAG: type IV secretory system conjugative DNA transfer family protein, partial [Peptostreptococcaceae bacterium]